MDTSQNSQELVKETVRKMGRNLLNYQIVERIWNEQLKIADVEARMVQGELKIINKPVMNRNIPMGWLSENHRKAIFSSPKEHEFEDEIQNISFKTSFRINDDVNTLSGNRKKQVLTLVKERNELVHSLSEKFDHITGDGCNEVCGLLDDQNVIVLKEIEVLNTISNAYKEAVAELIKILNSDEFVNALKNK